MTLHQHFNKKARHRRHRAGNAKAKENERLRCATYQHKLDLIAKSMRKKGHGQAVKVKGETMPTMLCANSRSSKSWKHLNGNPMRGESMKVAIIFGLT